MLKYQSFVHPSVQSELNEVKHMTPFEQINYYTIDAGKCEG